VSLSLRRGALATAAVLAFVPLAAGCGAGFDAGSEQVKPDNTSATIGQLSLLNVSVVLDQSTNQALVTGTVANNGSGSDQLEEVTAGGHEAKLAQPSRGSTSDAANLTAAIPATVTSLPIPGGQTLRLGSTGMAMATVSGSGLSLGRFVSVTFDFANAGTTTVQALVESPTGIYQGVTPAPTPSSTQAACATPTATAGSSATPKSSASATATATPKSSSSPAATATSTPTSTATACAPATGTATTGAATAPATPTGSASS
jgi:hypothetical protein